MCLIAFAYKLHPDFPLILIANRDEFYERPARIAQFWKAEHGDNILAGKDLKAGGTWLGVNKYGKWSALTNYRDIKNTNRNAPSRGDLVLNYLKNNNSAFEYLKEVRSSEKNYNGFNLLTGNRNETFHFDNITKSITEITRGIHGVSNAVLNTPWVKLEKAKAELEACVSANKIDNETLFEILLDEQKADDKFLPETGLTYDFEKAVSSIFIRMENYGTRCSTIILIDNKGKMTFTERTYAKGNKSVEAEVNFEID